MFPYTKGSPEFLSAYQAKKYILNQVLEKLMKEIKESRLDSNIEDAVFSYSKKFVTRLKRESSNKKR